MSIKYEKKGKRKEACLTFLLCLVSQEGGQVIMAATFVILACITPILLRSIYRILKKKLDRSSAIYGKLHCLDNR